jgi:dihydroxy-acid dehydratase
LRTFEHPFDSSGGLAFVRGTLAPDGAIFRRAGADPSLWKHRGPAVVFESAEDYRSRIDDPNLKVEAGSVLVVRNIGPIGGPGMPDINDWPIPKRLSSSGVRDMVRVLDGRVSGLVKGALVMHVCPEAAIGGPLALVREGDIIGLDAELGLLDLLVDSGELARRRSQFREAAVPSRGYLRLHRQHMLQADQGCDFDFLRFATLIESDAGVRTRTG